MADPPVMASFGLLRDVAVVRNIIAGIVVIALLAGVAESLVVRGQFQDQLYLVDSRFVPILPVIELDPLRGVVEIQAFQVVVIFGLVVCNPKRWCCC